MNFDTTLELIGQRFGFHPAALKEFADEDNLGGYSSVDANRRWPLGSLWEVEGKTLYALVRALRPERVVEIGTHRGASATHIASAMKVNGIGKLTCIDVNEAAGDLIPDALRPLVELVHEDGVDWLAAQPDGSIDLIFEDADHSTATSQAVAQLAQRKLAFGGVLAVHDAAHFLVGEAIRTGLTNAGLSYGVYLADPSDCGLGIWRQTAAAEKAASDEMPLSDDEIDALRDGHTLEVSDEQTKVVREHAPDKVVKPTQRQRKTHKGQ